MTVECIGYRSNPSGMLQGFADLRVERMGIEFYGCGVFMKDGKRWVSMPQREYTDQETGEKKYTATMRFIDRDVSNRFSDVALEALDKYCAEQQAKQEAAPVQEVQQSQSFDGGNVAKDQGELPF
jgi:hypothetical protein